MQQLIESTGKEQEEQLLTLFRGVHIPLLEHVMFVDEVDLSRNQVFGLYKVLVSHDALQAITDAWQSWRPDLVAPIITFIREQAEQVEIKRGAGEDVGIRKCLQRLQKVLSRV
ncbi:GM19173 [Drosophila sechellia]|uniref:GM19173 n=1 Tax=Drosophila sechellia TaxID=7238 RepID=B4I9J5_DROSE|nr:GM19173 [Drosophila sechellia]